MKKLLNGVTYPSTRMKDVITWGKTSWLIVIAVTILTFQSCQKETSHSEQQNNNAAVNERTNHEATVRVFATGFNNPRGLKFGPDGNLYVAEGGTGGTNTTSCAQVPPPVGPYRGSPTGGRISKVTPAGVRTTVTNSLPSSQTGPGLGNLVSGVADVEFIGNDLYAILAGAGCSHGVQSIPNGVVKVNSNGTWQMIANLSAWQQAHPVANPEPDDFEPDGTWYSMINVRGDLYAVEPNHGEMVKVTTSGDISRVIDISATQGHIVPTVVAYHGNFYVSNLNTFPLTGGASNIYKITPDGTIKVVATGFNAVLGLVIDQQNRMYVLENTAGPTFPTFPTPGFGRIVRLDPSGNRTVIATGLNLPTGMTLGPDGKLYVSNWGFGPPPVGLGEILQIDITE
jgi:sugar lactone lactonase YvrE